MSEPSAIVTQGMPEAAWQQIAAWLADSGLDSLEITGPDGQTRMLRQAGYQVQHLSFFTPPSLPIDMQEQARDQTMQVVAPHVGIFLDHHPQRSMPLVRPACRVSKGDVLCLLKVGLVLAPVVSPVDGVVTHVWALPGEVVGYGQQLFDIQREEAQWKSI